MSAPTIDRTAASELAGRLGSVVVLDVRSPAEFETAHVDGAVNVPVETLTARSGDVAAALGAPTVVVCQSGPRADRAAAALSAAGATDLSVLDGGMNAWSDGRRPVVRGRQRWAMERQVRLVAGSIVLGSITASMIAPRARFLAGAIGAGLTFSALSNTCAMASVLGRLPYNRAGGGAVDSDLSGLRTASTAATHR